MKLPLNWPVPPPPPPAAAGAGAGAVAGAGAGAGAACRLDRRRLTSCLFNPFVGKLRFCNSSLSCLTVKAFRLLAVVSVVVVVPAVAVWRRVFAMVVMIQLSSISVWCQNENVSSFGELFPPC